MSEIKQMEIYQTKTDNFTEPKTLHAIQQVAVPRKFQLEYEKVPTLESYKVAY